MAFDFALYAGTITTRRTTTTPPSCFETKLLLMGIHPNKKVATSSDGSTKEVDVIVIPTGYQHPFLLCGRKRLAES
jgi:hypothetical protein